jgi:hypothetical protein
VSRVCVAVVYKEFKKRKGNDMREFKAFIGHHHAILEMSPVSVITVRSVTIMAFSQSLRMVG